MGENYITADQQWAAKMTQQAGPGETVTCSLCGYTSGRAAFHAVHGNTTMTRINAWAHTGGGISYGAEATNAHNINFYNGDFENEYTHKSIPFTVENPLHEISRLMDLRAKFIPSSELGRTTISDRNVALVTNGVRSGLGFQGYPYQQNTFQNVSTETFADMALNYHENSFLPNSAGQALYGYMNTNMGHWVELAVTSNQ